MLQNIKKYVGKIVDVEMMKADRTQKVLVKMKITDVKDSSWGKMKFLVTPLEGSGQIWVQDVILDEEEESSRE